MKNIDHKLSPSRELAAKVVYAAMIILKENGGEMQGKDVVDQVGNRVEFSVWDKERYEKTGYIRWQSILHFFTIDCMKAGYMLKKRGVWYLTPEGEEALKKYNDVQLLENANKAYWEWKKQQPVPEDKASIEAEADETKERDVAIDEIEQLALESIEKAIHLKGPYEFQDLIAALLRGMGYYTPFVAPRGKDGGVDVIAYRDPLGTSSPRIKVQIKHREQTASVKEVRELLGVLQKDGDVGIFVSSSGFAPDARSTANSSHVHVELIDLPRFINLWREFYNKLTDDDKNLLPLRAVFFLSPTTA
jgi:Uncharacterized conserved protein